MLALTQNGITHKVIRDTAPTRYVPTPLVINGEPVDGMITKWKDNTYTYFGLGGHMFSVKGEAPLSSDPIEFVLPEGFKVSTAKSRQEAYAGAKEKREAAKVEAATNGEAPAAKPRGRKKSKAAEEDAAVQAQAAEAWNVSNPS